MGGNISRPPDYRRPCFRFIFPGEECSIKRTLIYGAFALLTGGQALAADLPPPVVPQAPAVYVPLGPAFSWTGIYLGVNGGGAYGRSSWADPVPAFPTDGHVRLRWLPYWRHGWRQ